MKIHILGICGTFMGGVALLAKQLGHQVSGCDVQVYPPMSTQLEQQSIELFEGFSPAQFSNHPDLVIIGNALSRGNAAVEYVLEHNIPYVSAPQWLAENVLPQRHVLAVAGTHGKTTTSSMLAWVLEYAGLQPGFIIGGVPQNFTASANLGEASYFVVEADEYDSAFFDKRAKFIHYRPHTLIMNNLEYDHADIFPDIQSLKLQFQYLVRTVPGNGNIIWSENDKNLQDVLAHGCWTPQTYMGKDGWHVILDAKDASAFTVYFCDQKIMRIQWSLIGMHNVNNALGVIAAASKIGIERNVIQAALKEFKSVKRRLEIKAQVNDITLYDDFAHHPTAIKATVTALRHKVGKQRIIALVELGSYTMRTGIHDSTLLPALDAADIIIFYQAGDSHFEIEGSIVQPWYVFNDVTDVLEKTLTFVSPNDHILIMSNRSFAGIHEKLLIALQEKYNE